MASLKTAIGACLVAIDKSAEAIQIFPSGTFDAPLGALVGQGPWHLNPVSAATLIAKVSQRKNDILIDYEHQSLAACKSGNAAPAAGWINPQSLVWTGEGLFAQQPDWKERAAAMIDADEYRYLSPVFVYDKATGVPTNLISVGLTNTPAIDGMAAVSLAAAMADFINQEEPIMELSDLMERLCYLFNLPITTTTAEMSAELDKVKALLGEPATAAASLPELLSGKETEIAALKSAIAVLNNQKPDPAQYVPLSAFLAVQANHQQLTQESQGQKVAALIAANPDVVIPALKEWATDLGNKDLGQLEDYIKNATPLAALTTTQTTHTPLPGKTQQLTTDELAVCKCLGIGQDEFLKNRMEG